MPTTRKYDFDRNMDAKLARRLKAEDKAMMRV